MAYSKVANVLLLAVIISLCSAQETFSNRLINGHWANYEQFNYQVAIVSRTPQTGQTFICSGAWVATQWILTSATCVLRSSEFELRSGSVNFYTGGTSVVSRVAHAHPQYDALTELNNFGLIQASGLTRNIIKFLPANSGLVLPGRQSIVTGWGLTTTHQISPVLQYTHGTILKSEDNNCKFNFKNVTVNSSSRLCAKFSGQSTCAGDTGSPLVIQMGRTNILVGVASFTPQYGKCDSSTSLFANFTSDARKWIFEVTGVRY